MAEVGPGKYDDECTQARMSTGADAVILLIVGGNRGHGFSVQCVNEDLQNFLPMLLRDVALSIEEAATQGTAANDND